MARKRWWSGAAAPAQSASISGGEAANLKGYDAEAVDPSGVGDCFNATLVTLLAAGYALPPAIRLANAAVPWPPAAPDRWRARPNSPSWS